MQVNKLYHRAIVLGLIATLFFIGCEQDLPTQTGSSGMDEISMSSLDKQGSNHIIPIALARADNPRDFVPDFNDEFVTIQGVITTPNFWNPASGAVHHFIQGNSASIQFFAGPNPQLYPNLSISPVLNIGDEVVVTGRIVHWRGSTVIRLESDGDLQIVGKRKIKKPKKIHAAHLADQVGERIEGQLVMLENIRIVDGQFDGFGLVKIVDSKGDTATVFIDRDTDIDGSVTPTGLFNLTGVATQYTFDTPADNRYQIVPRGLFDID